MGHADDVEVVLAGRMIFLRVCCAKLFVYAGQHPRDQLLDARDADSAEVLLKSAANAGDTL